MNRPVGAAARVVPVAAPAPRPSAAPAGRPAGYDATYWQTIDQWAGRPPARATRIDMLREPAAAWNTRLDLIRNAKRAVYASLYAIYPDPKGFQFLEELIAARRRGVDVCIAADQGVMLALGASKRPKERARLKELLAVLEREGGVIAWAGTAGDHARLPGAGVHFKALAADNEVAILGGRNIGEEYYGRWTDFDARLEGPIVETIGRAILRVLTFGDATPDIFGGDPARDARARVVRRKIEAMLDEPSPIPSPDDKGPLFRLLTWDPLEDAGPSKKPNAITEALIESCNRAQQEILITSNLVSPSRRLREALMGAAQRGVHVVLVTAGAKALGKLAHAGAATNYGDLVRAGCEIYETDSHEHGKMYLFDRSAGAFGSYNASMWANGRQAEGMLFSADREVLGVIEANIRQTLQRCKKYQGRTNPVSDFLRRILLLVAGRRVEKQMAQVQ